MNMITITEPEWGVAAAAGLRANQHRYMMLAADAVRRGDINLVIFHRGLWLAAARDVYPPLRSLDIDQPLGTPDTLADQWWAISRCGRRWDYLLVPLGDGGPDEWAAYQSDHYEIRSQKADVTCVYECHSLLDALLTRGEHYQWTTPPSLGGITKL